jgi:GMP synthase (glutamine-hydrolysing)
MHIHYIIHASFESLGAIESWAHANGHALSGTHTYKGEKLPDSLDFDCLIVMGGPQSPLHLDRWPYLQDEINLIKAAVDANKAILGICLGAQLIGEALGAKTQRSPQREIGVLPVELLPDAAHDPVFSQLPSTFLVMHWHNDMPGIPKDARILAKSAGCPYQAFSVGDRIYGLQFHLEMTAANIQEMLRHCEADLEPGPYVETKKQMMEYQMDNINARLFVLLDYFACKFNVQNTMKI